MITSPKSPAFLTDEQILQNATAYTIINDSAVKYPVLTADMLKAGKSEAELKTMDGENMPLGAISYRRLAPLQSAHRSVSICAKRSPRLARTLGTSANSREKTMKLTPEYAALLERLADLEPCGGYHSVSQILISETDVLTCIQQDEDIVCNAFSPVTDHMKRMLVEALTIENLTRRFNLFGIMASTCIHNEARVMLLDDVQEVCARRAQRQRTLESAMRKGDHSATAELDGAV